MKILSKIHFSGLVIVILNLLIFYFVHYELKYEIAYTLNIVIYLTGVILFFKSIKPLKIRTIYFSIFPITILSFGLFYLFGGIFFAILCGILIKPLSPEFSVYKKMNSFYT